MRNEGGKWQLYLPLVGCTLLGIIIGGYVWIAASTELRWAAVAVAIALISLGLGMQSFVFARYTDDRLKEISEDIKRLQALQDEIKVEQEKQKSTNTPVIASMAAISQLVDFFSKKKTGEGQGDEKT